MKRVWDIIGRKQTTVSSAATILILMVLASRILGLIRDRLLSARFSPEELGVYFAAFRMPNLIFELLIMGALTSAFIPVFTKYITRNEEKKGWRMTATLINVSLILLGLLSLPMLLWTRELSQFLAPGFSAAEIDQMVGFTRFMVVAQVLPLLIGSFLTGLLQSYNLFIVPALAPVIYNVGIIAGILIFSPMWGLYGAVIGVGLGALLFMLIQMPLLFRIGYRHSLSLDIKDQGVREVGRLIGPRTFGLAVSQIDMTVDLMLASLLGSRMVTIFNFAQHLQQLPVGLFGASIAQAALPTLSAASVKQDSEHFRQTIIKAIHQIFFFVMPASVFFIVLRIPIVRLVFGASRFDWDATVLTGITLSAFSISLFAQSLVHVLARGFYALYDTKTPVKVSVISIVINTILSVLFVQYWRLPIWSLGLSTSIASIVNATILFVLLDRRLGTFPRWELFGSPVKMLLASVFAGCAIFVPLKVFDQLVFDTTRTVGLLFLTGTATAAGLTVYLTIAWLFNVSEVVSFLSLIRRATKANSVTLEPVNEVVSSSNTRNL